MNGSMMIPNELGSASNDVGGRMLSVVGVVEDSGDTMVLTPERQRERSTEKIKSRDKTDRSCSVRKHYQSYYQTQRG